MKTRIYKTQFDTPFGNFIIAVDTIEPYANGDLRTAAAEAFNMPIATLKPKNTKRSNRRILAHMSPIKNCQSISGNGYWGWFQRVQGE